MGGKRVAIMKVTSKKHAGVYYNELSNGDKAYYVRYSVNGKRYDTKIGLHSEGIREALCKTRRDELLKEAKHGVIKHVVVGFDDLAQMYHRTKTSIATYNDMVKRYDFKIKPFFKNLALDKITEDFIYKFQRELINTKINKEGKKMAAATVNYYMTQVSSLLKYAVRMQLLPFSPASNIKQLKENNSRERYLTIIELKELVEAVEYDDDLLMFVELSMSTGGRMTSLMSVMKKDINMANATVSLADEKGKERYTAFLNSRTVKLLERKLPSLGINDRIYTSNIRRMQRQMKKILDKLFNVGLEVDDAKNRVVLHSLRHSFASHLAINGTSIFQIKELLNHKDIKQTMRYAKLSPDSGRSDVEGIMI